jgi:V/A-type H+-transporting ATPase subunit K
MKMSQGLLWAFVGATVAALFSGIGSAIGVGTSSRSATGVLSEKPERYTPLMLMVMLPSTQGFYGFAMSFLVLFKLGLFSGDVLQLSTMSGLQVLAACLPVGFAGLASAIQQGKVCAGGILMIAKRPELAFKAGVLYAVVVEVYAVLGTLITFLVLWFGVEWGSVA